MKAVTCALGVQLSFYFVLADGKYILKFLGRQGFAVIVALIDDTQFQTQKHISLLLCLRQILLWYRQFKFWDI